MMNILFIIYVIGFSINLTAGYSKECAIGSEYWCKSFEKASDCGAVYHCTNTVWLHENTHVLLDESDTCNWCQRIFENTQKNLDKAVYDEVFKFFFVKFSKLKAKPGVFKDTIVSTLKAECKLLLPNDVSSKCTNVMENYTSSAIELLKQKRFGTLCRLMNICTVKSTTKMSMVLVGEDQCTWGPSYWCLSLSNSRKCNSIDHCSKQIWSQQVIEREENDKICEYCRFIIDQIRSILIENTTEIKVEKWLAGVCSLLEIQENIDECKKTISEYEKEILILIENNIDSNLICHLGEICKNATIVPRIETQSNNKIIDEQLKMLCNVIVRATHDLYDSQQQSPNDIEEFLKDDCQKLTSYELKEKCENLVDRHGNIIYEKVMMNMESSKICDHIDLSSYELISPVACELCTFNLANVKSMLDNQHSDEEILTYIDENLCSRSTNELKQNCTFVIETMGNTLIYNIKRGMQPLLLCNYFQVCHDKIYDAANTIQRSEVLSFLSENICNKLGLFGKTCHGLMKQDTTSVLKALINNIDGDVLCQIFGLFPANTPIMDNLSINDDKNVCKQCVDDFTRRKHIAEKLLNHSSQFLHHLCEQLPQKDQCTQSVDDSMNTLADFMRSLNPQDICVELKLCTTISLNQITPIIIATSDNIISKKIIDYAINEICTRLGPLSKLCLNIIESEVANISVILVKGIDPRRVCDVIDVCPSTTAFENCNDKCGCCIFDMENYQVKLASFLQSIFVNSNQMATKFKSSFDKVINSFNAKEICQSLTHCSASPKECTMDNDKCSCCQNHLNLRKNYFRTIINDLTTTLISLCNGDSCHSSIQMNQREVIDKINKIKTLVSCQRFGLCTVTLSLRSMPFLSHIVPETNEQDLSSLVEESSDKLCSDFGTMTAICEHLIASTNAAQNMKFYLALLSNNSKLIDDDLREQITDTCDQCRNSVQSSKDVWTNGLESARNALLQTCESFPFKDQCRNFFNQQFDNLQSFINTINPEQVCQTIHLCSISTVDKCSTCVERLKLKTDGLLQAAEQLTRYFRDLCQRDSNKQCQIYIQEVYNLIQISLEDLDLTETCATIGFCKANADDDNDYELDTYVKHVEDKLEEKICSTLGPFETLCNSIVRGDTAQIQGWSFDYSIKDLIYIDEQLTESSSNVENFDQSTPDKCKRCIFRVMHRKRHTKFIGDKIFFTLIHACRRCPAKHECRKHWLMRKSRFDAHIDRINPKCVCIHLDFCNKSVLCDNMDSFEEECEESIEWSQSKLLETTKTDSFSATCAVCEYVMNILSNYINRQSNQKEIEENLEKVCDLIPSMLKTACHDYIDNYSPTIIVLLLQEFDLSTICHKLNLCTQQMKIDITHIVKADITTCGICDYISTYMNFALKRDSHEASSESSLSTVCTHLSDEQQTKCQTIIHLVSPYIQQLKLSPGNNFCQELPLCQTPMIELQPAVPLKKVNGNHLDKSPLLSDPISSDGKTRSSTSQELTETTRCTLCHYIISYLDAVLKNNKSEQAVEEALQKVCTILPSQERSACDQFITSYGSVLAELIAQMADPDSVCRYLGVCQDLKMKTSTNYTKCMLGMKYWCTSRANAELCNAVELCERHAWLKKIDN